MEIPKPSESHNKAEKLTNEETERRNKLLAQSLLTKGWVKSRPDKQCHARTISEDLQKKFSESVYPVCPVLSKLMKDEDGNELAAALTDLREKCSPCLLKWCSVFRILRVFESLIKLKTDFQTLVNCAHTKNFLKGRLDSIRNDLSALPQSLERDFPETSKDCKELIEELKRAERAYSGPIRAYLAPRNLDNGNWKSFLSWRDQQINPMFCSRIDIFYLTSYYPAEAIEVMYNLYSKLLPLAVKILPEQALVKNQYKEELKAELLSNKAEDEEKEPNNPYIKKDENVWEFCFNGEKVSVNSKLKGLALIEFLLIHPNKEYTPLELMQNVGQRDKSETEPEKIYSEMDIQEIKKAIQGLEDRKEQTTNLEEKERFEDQIKKANNELYKTRNYAGKSRNFSDRDRKAVERNIKTVVNNLSSHKTINNHFNRFLKSGVNCCYKPDTEIFWEIS